MENHNLIYYLSGRTFKFTFRLIADVCHSTMSTLTHMYTWSIRLSFKSNTRQTAYGVHHTWIFISDLITHFLSSNIPITSTNSMFAFQLMRYSKACLGYRAFLVRRQLIISKRLSQRFIMLRLKNSLKKLYRRLHNPVDTYPLSDSQRVAWLSWDSILRNVFIEWTRQCIIMGYNIQHM